MTEVYRKSFQDHLNEVSNPAPNGQTKGTLAEFRQYGGAMEQEARRRWGADEVEEEVRTMQLSPAAQARMLAIAVQAANGELQPQVKKNLGRNKVERRPQYREGGGDHHD